LRPGDIILAVTAKGDTQDVRSVQQFNQIIAQMDAKAPATLLIRRSNVQIFVPIPQAQPAQPGLR
jgi:S1-C subfamily serine protease